MIGFVLRVERTIPVAWPRWRTVSGFLRFSGNTQLVGWADLVNYQTDKVVIALAVGPSAAGAYELANRVATAARQVGVYSLSALLPTLSADLARFGMDAIRRRYRRLLTITASIGLPLLLLVAAIAPLLLMGWLSHVPRDAVAVLAALSLAYIANVSSGVSYVVGAAAGAPGIAARAATGTAVLNLALTAALAPLFGIWGVLAGTVVALTAGALAQVVMVHRRFELSLLDYRAAVVPTLVAGAVLAAPIAVISYSGPGHRPRAWRSALSWSYRWPTLLAYTQLGDPVRSGSRDRRATLLGRASAAPSQWLPRVDPERWPLSSLGGGGTGLVTIGERAGRNWL